jgi:DNA-binding transcriptional regulator PaaX
MTLAYSIESAIHQQLARAGTCSLDELAALLPGYSWAQVFAAVDRMTREGTVALKHPGQFRYLLSLAARRSAEARQVTLV